GEVRRHAQETMCGGLRSCRRWRISLRADNQLAKGLGRKEARNVGHFHRRLETRVRNFAQVALELDEPFFGDDAFLLEFTLRQIAARILDDLAARNLDLERALEPKHHVQE